MERPDWHEEVFDQSGYDRAVREQSSWAVGAEAEEDGCGGRVTERQKSDASPYDWVPIRVANSVEVRDSSCSDESGGTKRKIHRPVEGRQSYRTADELNSAS